MAIIYPYIPKGREIQYVGLDNPYMNQAYLYAKRYSLDDMMPNASVAVRGKQVLVKAANGNIHHKKFGCERVRLNIPTGQQYELCAGCSCRDHSEAKLVRAAKSKKIDLKGAFLYLWGHWWCCEPCWDSMLSVGIKKVYLLENSEVLFNKKDPRNIVGKQFKV